MPRKVSRTYVSTVTPTLDTSAYASGDRLGSIQTISGALMQNEQTASIMESISVLDKSNQKIAIDLLFFSANPTVTSADNAAIDISNAEMAAKFIGLVQIPSTAWVTIVAATNAVATVSGVGLTLANSAQGTSVFVVPVARGAATYTSSSLVFVYGILQD